jgi:hypothetical protein
VSQRPAHESESGTLDYYSQIEWQARELISKADGTALRNAVAEHRLVERITDELVFLGFVSESNLNDTRDYLRRSQSDLESRAQHRLRMAPHEPSLPPAQESTGAWVGGGGQAKVVRIFAYGVNRPLLEQAIRTMQAPAMVVLDPDQADVVMTIRNYYHRRPQPLRDAEAGGVPIYVLQSNTGSQIEEAVSRVAVTRVAQSSSLEETTV